MRDLTLIVTDCHVPMDLGREALATIERLPTAELVRARGTKLCDSADWWQAVPAVLGADGLKATAEGSAGQIAIAGIAWYGISGRRADNMWLATPVRFTAAIDHVRLDGVGVPASAHVESIIDEFNRDFAEERVMLRRGSGEHLFLEVSRSLSALSVDPGRIVGGNLADSLPTGPDAPYLRRLMTEIQMWLHTRIAEDSPFNALWLWGGGGAWPDLSGRTLPAAASSEPFLRGLWRLGGADSLEPIVDFAAARGLAASALIVTLSLERWRAEGELQPLLRLERDWLAPAWSALASGQLVALGLSLNGVFSRVTRRESWRFWRSRRHWAES